MDFRPLIKEVGRGARGARELPRDDAERLFGAMLDGEVPEIELGALLMAYRIKGESAGELAGFLSALAARLERFEDPAGEGIPVVLPSYNGARKLPNLTPLVAMTLASRGIPVLIHGNGAVHGRITTESVLRALDIPVAASCAEAKTHLAQNRLAYVDLGLLSPGLARLLAIRERMGVRSSGHTVAKLLDPFFGKSVRVVPMTHPEYLSLMRDFLGGNCQAFSAALLFRGHEGEPCAGPRRALEADVFMGGLHSTLATQRPPDVPLPETIDAQITARWTREALAGAAAIPSTVATYIDWCESLSRGRRPGG